MTVEVEEVGSGAKTRPKREELVQKQIDDLHQEMANKADLRNCYIEANFYDKINDISY